MFTPLTRSITLFAATSALDFPTS
uniref:Umc1139 n=1 Tax=Arundo donax TaxID=35708 RepID=A0A0A9ELL0_ARUDO